VTTSLGETDSALLVYIGDTDSVVAGLLLILCDTESTTLTDTEFDTENVIVRDLLCSPVGLTDTEDDCVIVRLGDKDCEVLPVWPQHVLFVRPLHPVDGNDTNPRTEGGKNRGDSSALEP